MSVAEGAAAVPLGVRTPALGISAASFGSPGWFRCDARLRFSRRLAEQIVEAIACILAVLLLCAVPIGANDKDAVFGQSPSCNAPQPYPDRLGEARAALNVEAEFHRCRNFVYILPTRTGGANEVHLYIAFVDGRQQCASRHSNAPK